VRAHKLVLDQDITTSSTSVELSPECIAMIQEISKYDDVLKKTITTHHPHLLCQYGYSLARVFNTLYNSESILYEKNSDYKNAKLYIVSRFMETLEDVF
jgi:arginyl-tRNA synthetase